MARLSKEQWDKVKADYITGRYSTRALAEKHGVSNAAVSKKANSEGWQVIEPGVVDNLVRSKIVVDHGLEKLAEVNKVNSVNLIDSVNELVEFELKSNKRMAMVEDKAMDMLTMIEKPTDAKAIMDTLVKHREARLGKSPDTAIQINNNISVTDLIDELG
jgi:hypothetical protein